MIFQVDDADLAMARILELFAPPVPRPAAGIDPAARIAPGTSIPADARIGYGVGIGTGGRCGRAAPSTPAWSSATM